MLHCLELSRRDRDIGELSKLADECHLPVHVQHEKVISEIHFTWPCCASLCQSCNQKLK